MRRKRYGFLSILLAFVMAFATILPSGVGQMVAKAEETQSYELTISSDADSVETGNLITLTAKVTCNGEEITDISSVGLHLYWWNNTAGEGNGDSWFVNCNQSTDNVLALQMKPQLAGTYEIQAKLQDSSWKDLTIQKYTINVTGENAGGNETLEGYQLTISSNMDSVEVGNPIALTAKVTNNGQEITDLETAGMHLYWWNNTTNSDGWFVDYDGTNGYALTLQVNPQVTGTYEIQAKLQDSSWKDLAIQKCTIKVTDASTTIVGDLDVAKVSNLPENFIMGMDISSVIAEFDSGVTFKDYEGNTINNVTAFCKFLASNGITHIRVRVWNDPYNEDGKGYGGGNNDVDKAKQIADGCREAGIKMLVDFHCSDLWTDPGKQMAPKAWASYTADQKASSLSEFLTSALNTIDPNKDTVAMVQVGNETTNGFIGESDVEKMCQLFSAGVDAVHAYNGSVKAVIHVTNPEKGNVTKWAKNLSDNNVNYDILATSYYPYWHGTLDNLKSEFTKVKTTYGKDVMVAETSYAYTLKDSDGHDNTVRPGNNDSGGFCTEPFSIQGQATSIRNLINAVNEAGGLGVFYWEPAWITVGDITGLDGGVLEAQITSNRAKWEEYGSGWASSYASEYDADDAGQWFGGSAVDNEAMFYPDGTPTAGLKVWNYVKTGAISNKVSVLGIENAEQTITSGGTYALPGTVKVTYNKETVDEIVSWNESDIAAIKVNVPGTYVVNGTVAFSKIVDDGEYAGMTEAAVTYQLTVKPQNLITDAADAGFEKGDNFTIGGAGISNIPSKDDPYAGTGSMHWYSVTVTEGTVTYNPVLSLEAGEYTFEAVAQGKEGDMVRVQILDTADQVLFEGEKTVLAGYANWKTPTVTFVLKEKTDIKLRIVVNMLDGGWGTVDELFLHRKIVQEPDTGTSPGDTDGSDDTSTGDNNGSGDTTPGDSDSSGNTTPGDNDNSGDTSTGDDNGSGGTTPGDNDNSSDTSTGDNNSSGDTAPGDNSSAHNGSGSTSSGSQTTPQPDNTSVVANPDGGTTETRKDVEQNQAGNAVSVTTVTVKDASGRITSVTKTSVIANAANGTSATVTVETNGVGVVSVAADVTRESKLTATGRVNGTISAAVVKQIVEAAKTSDVLIRQTVTNTDGSTRFTVEVHAQDLAAGGALKIMKLDPKTNEYYLCNAKDYEVSKDGGVNLTLKTAGNFVLLNEKDAKAASDAILKTIKVKKSSASVKAGKTVTAALNSALNMKNVSKITYTTSNKAVAAVDKKGKVTAKKSGTVSIKVKVVLKNGETKTVTMKVTVKK